MGSGRLAWRTESRNPSAAAMVKVSSSKRAKTPVRIGRLSSVAAASTTWEIICRNNPGSSKIWNSSPTAGSSGNPRVFTLPSGGSVRFSTGAFRRIGGRLIEDAGIVPYVEVEYSVADFRSGRDPDLEAAEALFAD